MTITNSALVNDVTNIVENICVAQPVTPSPYSGLFMVGLEDPVYDADGNIVVPGTPCDIGWIYDPATGTFAAP